MGPGARPGRRVDMPPHSRDSICPRFAKSVAPKKERAQCDPKRDAGKTGCALHPRSHVPMHMQRKTHMSIQVQRKQSGLPCAMV